MLFCANLSTMFSNLPFADRYSAAAELGFKAVESQYIPDTTENSKEILVAAMKEAKVVHVLLNSYPGTEEETGFASLPAEEEAFYNSVSRVMPYAFHLGVKKIHILSGVVPDDATDLDYREDIFCQRLKTISDMLEEHDIMGLIEPLCPKVKENYFLSSFTKAIEMLQKIDCSNIKLLLDVYHLQQIEGTVQNLEEYVKYAGHIQLSQSPNRTELGSDGDIDFKDVLKRLKSTAYKGYVGLEYFPTTSVKESLSFLESMGFSV